MVSHSAVSCKSKGTLQQSQKRLYSRSFEGNRENFAMVKKSITKKLLKYAEAIQKEGVPVNAVILFGSQVSGKGGRDSDIDVCVVSKRFGRDSIEEGCFLQRLAHRIDPRIEPIAVSLKEYRKNKYLPILHAIRKNGLRIV